MKRIISTILLLFNIMSFSQELEKTIDVMTVSTSESKSEAIKLALRDALEQTFGTFISSSTEILSDEIVKDEITSLSSGNILKYEIISELQLPNGLYSVSIKSTVSIKSFATYMQNKGHKVSFSGSKFTMDIKLLNLNQQSEDKAIKNMIVVLKEMMKNSVDFKILASSEPILDEISYVDRGVTIKKKLYKVRIDVGWELNKNYTSFENYFIESLKGISMKNSEINKYLNLNKDIHQFLVIDKENLNYDNENIKDIFPYTQKYPSSHYIGGQQRLTLRALNPNSGDVLDSRRFHTWLKENEAFIKSKYPSIEGKELKNAKKALRAFKMNHGKIKHVSNNNILTLLRDLNIGIDLSDFLSNDPKRKSFIVTTAAFNEINNLYEKYSAAFEKPVNSQIEKMIRHNTILNMNFTESETKAIFDSDFLKKLNINTIHKSDNGHQLVEFIDSASDSTKVYEMITNFSLYKYRIKTLGENYVLKIISDNEYKFLKNKGGRSPALFFFSANNGGGVVDHSERQFRNVTYRKPDIREIAPHTSISLSGDTSDRRTAYIMTIGKLRGHSKLYFRNSETLRLINEFLYDNLKNIYNFDIKFGEFSFNPRKYVKNTENWRGSRNIAPMIGQYANADANYNLVVSTGREDSLNVKFRISPLTLPGTVNLKYGASSFLNNSAGKTILGWYPTRNYYSDIHFINKTKQPKDLNTHRMVFYLSLEDLEKVESFELVNNN